MYRLIFVIRIPRKNINGLKKELNGDQSLHVKVKLPPKSQGSAEIVEIRIDVSLTGSGHERIVRQTIEAHKGTIVGTPDIIGNRSEFDRIKDIVRQGWLLIIISYVTIVGSVALFKVHEITDGTFPYLTVLLGSIPIAIGTVLARVRMIKIDIN